MQSFWKQRFPVFLCQMPVCAIIGMLLVSASQGAEFLSLGNFGDGFSSQHQSGPQSTAISRDGTTITGASPGPLWEQDIACNCSELGVFRWTRESGMVAVSDSALQTGGHLPAMSHDGSMIYWWGIDASLSNGDTWVWSENDAAITVGNRAFSDSASGRNISFDNSIVRPNGDVVEIWSRERGFESLFELPVNNLNRIWRVIVSADGSTVLGTFSIQNQGGRLPFRWTADQGLTILPTLPGQEFYLHQNPVMSLDGSVFAGMSRSTSDKIRGLWRWTESEGMILLQEGTLEMSFFDIEMSDNGDVIVANYDGGAFLWTDNQGIIDLEPLPGFSSNGIRDISANGRFVLGYSYNEGNRQDERYWLWSDATGMRDFEDVLTEQQIRVVTQEWQRLFVPDTRRVSPSVSVDGLAITGTGLNASGKWEAWVAYLDPLEIVGDFNRSGELDVMDIDMLTQIVSEGMHPARFDLNNDALVDDEDQRIWVEELANTYFGDSNLDGEFGTSDLVAVFVAGQYEDTIDGNSTWATGDWNGDGDFTTGDLTLAFQSGGFEQGPRDAMQAVPEPTSWVVMSIGLFGIVTTRRSRSA